MARNMKMELLTFSLILYQSKNCGHRIHVLFMMYAGTQKVMLNVQYVPWTRPILSVWLISPSGSWCYQLPCSKQKWQMSLIVMLFMMYDVYWYCQMKKKRMIMKILKKEWSIWKFWKKGEVVEKRGGRKRNTYLIAHVRISVGTSIFSKKSRRE
jgi:hypothetical protein